MRKLLVVVVVIALLWGGVWLLARQAEKQQLEAPWPAGLGPVSSVPARYPDRPMNASAQRLVALAAGAGVELQAGAKKPMAVEAIARELSEYIRGEMTRAGVAAPGPLPPKVTQYVIQRGAALGQVRQHLLTAPLAEWPQQLSAGTDVPMPNLLGKMYLARLFTAIALQTRDWESLHAVWQIERQLHGRPDLISQLITVAIGRMINAAARSMPLPEPAWMNEFRAHDYGKAMLAAMQAETWMSRQLYAESGAPGPYVRLAWADINEAYVEALGALSEASQCTTTANNLGQRIVDRLAWWNQLGKIAVPNLGAAWQRVARLRIEIEATEKFALARQGRFDGKSRCSDGAWVLDNGVLKFTKPVPPVPAPDIAVPIELRVTAQTPRST